jgi:hypothetical protein
MRQILFLCVFASTSLSTLEAKPFKRPPHIDAIYGADDRSFVSSYSPKNIQNLASSVAMIVSKDNTKKGLLKTTIFAQPLKENMKLCKSERHENEPTLTGCTGFLVGPDLLATAGHCVDTEHKCSDITIAFGVYTTEKSSEGFKIAQKDIYNCKEVIAREFDGERDFAIIRLDRVVKKRSPLKLNLSKEVTEGTSVFMLGHPLGLPMLHSKPAPVNVIIDDFSFKATLDSFAGNSGSPVINAQTSEVEGILVRGEEDFVKDEEGCYRYKKYETQLEPLRGEGVSKISELREFLK